VLFSRLDLNGITPGADPQRRKCSKRSDHAEHDQERGGEQDRLNAEDFG
jgi:hypothetical protein